MVYYRKIIKTTTYAGRNFFVYIIEENEDDKTEYLIDKMKSYVDNNPQTKKLWDNVTLGIDQELEVIEIDADTVFEKVGIEFS